MKEDVISQYSAPVAEVVHIGTDDVIQTSILQNLTERILKAKKTWASEWTGQSGIETLGGLD